MTSQSVPKKQQSRYSDEELGIIKNTFEENENLAKALRKYFIQFELSKEDNSLLDNFIRSKKNVQSVLRKTFLPTIDGNAPIHQVFDLWMTIGIKEKSPEQAYPLLLSRAMVIKYLDSRLTELEGGKKTKTSIAKLLITKNKSQLEAYVNITTRNIIIEHTEMQIAQLLILAGSKEETLEQVKERLLKNSTK